MQAIPPEIIDHFGRGTAALFVGSDLPSGITGLPSRAELADELARRVGLPAGKSFSEIAELVVGPFNQRNSLITFLLEKFNSQGKRPSKIHQLAAQLPAETIITTAYDDSLEQALRQINRPYDTVVTPPDIALANRPGRVTVVYLYGKLGGDLDQLILTKSDHIGMNLRSKKAPLLDLVRHVFQTRAVFFLGYDLSDPDFELMYSQVLENMKPFHIGAWATSPPVDALYRDLWASKGIRNIAIKPVDTLESLLDEQKVPDRLDSSAMPRDPSGMGMRDDFASPTLAAPPTLALPQGFNPQGTITLLFSDIENSTSITERLGDIRGQEVLRVHNDMVRQHVMAFAGFEVKSMGDGFMVAFSSARRALQCAIAIQRDFAAYNDDHPDEPIRVRMGLHTGEVINEAGDFFGRNVILAARIASQAHGGQILVSSLLKDLTESSREFTFSKEQDVDLKGLSRQYRIVEVKWQE